MKPIPQAQIPGNQSRQWVDRESRYIAPGLQGFAQWAGITVHSARGTTVTDVDGNSYIDLIGGIGVAGIGHSHPRWVKAMQNQIERHAIGSFTSTTRVELLEALAAHRPRPRLDRIQLYSSGAEAVESAIRLARCATGRYEIVSFWGGFHGKTAGTLSLMGSSAKSGFGPLPAGSHQIPYADCARCPLKLKPANCALACVELGRQQIKRASSGSIAAFIVEPMQGTAGNIIPPKGFLRAVQDLAQELGALLIADEMITGFGRTGKYWGIDHSEIDPDIITIGKQFGSGYPVSAVIAHDDIVNARPWALPSGSSSSYGGNPLAAASALATLQIIDEEGLVENSRKMGEHFVAGLRELQKSYEEIGEIRSAGLFIGLDLIQSRSDPKPLSEEKCKQIFFECLKRGLLTMAYSPSFRIQPAMVINKATIDDSLKIIGESIDAARRSGPSL